MIYLIIGEYSNGADILNSKIRFKLIFSIILLVVISLSVKYENSLGKILNRVDGRYSNSKINFSFEVLDTDNNKIKIDLSNIYVFLQGDNGDRYIIDLSDKDKELIDKMFDYNYDNLHNIVSQNYNVIVAKKIDSNTDFDKTKSFSELSNSFIKLYNGYNLDGEYKLIIPNTIYINNNSNVKLNIYAKEIYGNNINLSLLNNLKEYTNYNIFTKYYSSLIKNNLSICTDTIIRLNNNINTKYYTNKIFYNNYLDNDIYSDSKYLSNIINNNKDDYMDLLNDIYISNKKYNLVLSKNINFNNEFNKINDISDKLYNGISNNDIKFYYTTINEFNNNMYEYNDNRYVIINIDCTDNDIVQIDDNSNNNIIYNFYKIKDNNKVQYDGEIFINNMGENSILLAPKALVHSSSMNISNVISYEFIQE